MAKKKIIGGLEFQRDSATTRGRDAERIARNLRKEGFLAQIREEQIGSQTIFVIFKHDPKRRNNNSQSPMISRKSKRITPKTPRLRK